MTDAPQAGKADAHQHILVVDDDEQVRRMLRRCLEDEGYVVTEAQEQVGVDAALARGVDLITLDLNLGGTDGLAVARSVRRNSNVPIIMITGKGDMIDRIVGLELGADDYIAKPFHLREVLARIRSVLRRSGPHTTPDAIPATTQGNRIMFDGFALDLDRRELTNREGDLLRLTSGELDLLVVFATHAHRVLSRDQIMDLLKGLDWAPNDRSIDNQVARLRKVIEADAAEPRLLKTVRGAGYSFTPRELAKA